MLLIMCGNPTEDPKSALGTLVRGAERVPLQTQLAKWDPHSGAQADSGRAQDAQALLRHAQALLRFARPQLR